MKIYNSNDDEITYERLTLSNKSYMGTKEEWGVYFTSAMEEIAVTKMRPNSRRLICLLISHLANSTYSMGDNRVVLLNQDVYGNILNIAQSRFPDMFDELEKLGFIKRFKETKSISITINPAVAYRGKFKDYTRVHNQLVLPFGNVRIKEPTKAIDWKNEETPQEIEFKEVYFDKKTGKYYHLPNPKKQKK